MAKKKLIKDAKAYLDLDDFWEGQILFHARDKYGNLKIRPKDKGVSRSEDEQWKWDRKHKLGWPDWYTRDEFRVMKAREKERAERLLKEMKDKTEAAEKKKRGKRG